MQDDTELRVEVAGAARESLVRTHRFIKFAAAILSPFAPVLLHGVLGGRGEVNPFHGSAFFLAVAVAIASHVIGAGIRDKKPWARKASFAMISLICASVIACILWSAVSADDWGFRFPGIVFFVIALAGINFYTRRKVQGFKDTASLSTIYALLFASILLLLKSPDAGIMVLWLLYCVTGVRRFLEQWKILSLLEAETAIPDKDLPDFVRLRISRPAIPKNPEIIPNAAEHRAGLFSKGWRPEPDAIPQHQWTATTTVHWAIALSCLPAAALKWNMPPAWFFLGGFAVINVLVGTGLFRQQKLAVYMSLATISAMAVCAFAAITVAFRPSLISIDIGFTPGLLLAGATLILFLCWSIGTASPETSDP